MSETLSRLADTSSYDPQTIECPWHYDAMLREQSPVNHDVANDIYVVSSYALVEEVLNQPMLYSSRYLPKMLGNEALPAELMTIYAKGFEMREALLVTDGEVHDHHRRIAVKAFSTKRLKALAPLFRQRTAALLDDIIPQGKMEFRAALAHPVPINILQQQLRVADADMPRALEWSVILDSGFSGAVKSMERLKYEAEQIVAFQHYVADRVNAEIARIEATGHGERDDDLLTQLAQSILDPASTMDIHEAVSYVMNLFPATHGTTTSAMMACMQRFTAHPEVQERIADDPSLIDRLIDESMRHEAPARAFWRRTLQHVTLGGVVIPKDQWVLLRISSANRDACTFANPDAFDIDRELPSRHLTFSSGIHFCIGRVFARHIIAEVIGQLAQRARDFRFIEGANSFRHAPNMLSPGYEELHIAFTPR